MNFNIARKINVYLLLSLLVLAGCSSNYQWGWYVILPNNKIGISNIEFLIGGLGYTIILSVISIIIAIFLGLIVSVASISRNRALNYINVGYTEIIRAIPVLVMILWVYYGLPVLLNLILPALGNQFVYMLKMSSLVSIIGLNELTRKANELVVSQYRPLEIYTFLVLEYLFLILVVSFLVRRLEKRLKVY